MVSTNVRRFGGPVTGLVALAVTSMALLGGGSASGSATATTAAGGTGLAQRFVGVGLCDGGPRYRVEFHEVSLTTGPQVVADLLVSRAGERARWDWTGVFRTTFADGSKVSGVSDFGQARSTRNGTLRLRQGTAAGAWHSIAFSLNRRSDGAHCRVVVRG